MKRKRQNLVRYSLGFRQQIVRELELNPGQNYSETARKYGIRASSTVWNWMQKYGPEHLKAKVIHVRTPQERDEVKELKRRNRELEAALADMSIELLLERGYLTVACKHGKLGGVEEFKKKAPMNLSTARSKSPGPSK